MTNKKINITPETNLGHLLESYPQLENDLLNMSPSFAKLKDPALRKTVAKIASLRQIAETGNIPLADLINQLRKKVGQDTVDFSEQNSSGRNSEKLKWAEPEFIARTFDARPVIASGGHPLTKVMQDLPALAEGKSYELITPFLPVPLLDMVKSNGYQVWAEQIEENLVKCYFSK